MNEDKILKDLSKWVDDRIPMDKWVGGIGGKIAEIVDGHLFRLAINIGYEKLPEDYKDEFIRIASAIVSGNYNAIGKEVVNSFVENVKTPLGDKREQIILGGIWNIIHELIELDRAEKEGV